MPPRPRFDRRAPVRELPNINDRINYPQLRVVDSDGAQLGVISREEALDVARDRELDLVLVSEKADPPVCRIMDYGKFKFEQEKKAKEAKKKSHQTEVKEVKMRYKIDQHDYDVRIGQAQRFLKAGDKVKCTVIFRGREIQHTALAETLLRRMAQRSRGKSRDPAGAQAGGPQHDHVPHTTQNAVGEKRGEGAGRQQGPCAPFPHRQSPPPPRWPAPRAKPQGRQPAASAIPWLRPGD